MKMTRLRIVAWAAALMLGVAVPVVATALPAHAANVYCEFGDNFYQFRSNLSLNYSLVANTTSGQYLYDTAGGGTLFCQANGYVDPNGNVWYQWVEKNTSNCLTYDIANGNVVKLETCDTSKFAQFWLLTDQLSPWYGWEDFGLVQNEYNTSITLGLYDNGHAETFDNVVCIGSGVPIQPPQCSYYSTAWQWILPGPYK